MHSSLIPHSPAVDFHPEEDDLTVGGFARLAHLVGQLRAKKEAAGEPVVLLGAADYLGGSPYAWLALAGQAPELALMQQIGYDVITIGNHEFDYGPEVLAGYLEAAGYPQATAITAIVASNIGPPANHPPGRGRHSENLYSGAGKRTAPGFFWPAGGSCRAGSSSDRSDRYY